MSTGPVAPTLVIRCQVTVSSLVTTLISWPSKRHPTASHSSVEAEYRAVANAVAKLYCPLEKAIIVYCDNISAVYMSSNPVQHRRTKHIELDIHFVHEKIALGELHVLHVPSSAQFADVMTKGLPMMMFTELWSSLSIRPSDTPTVAGC